MKSEKYHKPVLVREVKKALNLSSDAHLNRQAWYVDATLGNAGHTMEMMKQGGCVLGIEMDQKMLKIAKNRLKDAYPVLDSSQAPYVLVQGNFSNLETIIKESKIGNIRGILFDLGVNSLQLTSKKRGFSFLNPDCDLDMRMDRNSQSVTAADLLNTLREDQLMQMFLVVCEYKQSRKLAKRTVEARDKKQFSTVGDFLEICDQSIFKKGKTHPATKAFLALRIAVNSELDSLEKALPQAFNALETSGRLVVISFHSTEDKLVKSFFKEKVSSGVANLITKKPTLPSESEVNKNPRARSAKLRAIEKIS